ncbi:hypothetical protein ERO13_D09G238500v2 [Gossypium hirsutum]|uniref:Uncharacterized protein n=1 Tax=Gossypium barbadense TaxID=3634 RepID=A0A5J5Q9H0_GOSBA|nr:hypothetical protein ES319_D09G258500v1 [Gossypium barbadense]KAG4131825.1 hypothetical protein ERO13_D09G238500v2 [Gossypium hirsutum]
MSNKSPIFPIHEPQHFSDYGFDPQIDYFQVLEEAKKHRKETPRSIDSLHFKLQKPISKDEQFTKKTQHKLGYKKKKRYWWWKNALFFFKWKKMGARAFMAASMSGPVYITESRSGSTTPYRTSVSCRRRPSSSGPLTPYLSLRELNMEYQQRVSSSSTSAMPIYLVT